MARTALSITTLTSESADAFVLASAGTAIDATNNHSITPPADCDPRELVLFITHTTASEKTVTVKAGDNPPAVRAGLGDVTATLAAGNSTATHAIIPLTGSRFLQDDGTISVDVAASTTGRIAVLRVPRNV
jgi:hypothetical protein